MRNEIIAFNPTKRFPVISLSNSCALNCEHCRGIYLRGMLFVKNPEELYSTALKFEENGMYGFLVSGGYDLNGRLLNIEKFIPALKRIKENTNLKILLHSSFLPKNTVEEISSFVDMVSVDIIGSDETYRKVMHLNVGVEDLVNLLNTYEDLGVDYAPHLIAGIYYGKIVGERKAIEILKDRNFRNFVFLTLIPTKNTPMENVELDWDEILQILRETKVIKARKLLGCMRVRNPMLEIEAVKNGYEGIVLPTKEAREYLVNNGYKLIEKDICCAMV